MASFRQHGNRWQARVRRQGYPDITKSFQGRQDAERWARSVESDIDRGSYVSLTEAQKTTLADLIQRYMAEVLPSMKGATEDSIRLKAICRRPICKNSIAALTPAKVAEYRDLRLTEVAAGTVVSDLSHALDKSLILNSLLRIFRDLFLITYDAPTVTKIIVKLKVPKAEVLSGLS